MYAEGGLSFTRDCGCANDCERITGLVDFGQGFPEPGGLGGL